MKPTETHHIVFRSQGGSDDPENLVEMGYKEHAELHAWEFINGGPWFDNRLRGASELSLEVQDMVFQEQSLRTTERNLSMVENGTHPSFTEKHRKRFSELGKKLCSHNGTGSERDQRRVTALKMVHAVIRECPHCLTRGAGTVMLRWHFDNCPKNTGQKPTQAQLTCPHCGLVGGISNMKRYHFENCKHNETN